MKVFFVSLLICFSLHLSAQNQVLKGQFTGDNLEKSFINVINVNQYKATISQLDGKFEIQAKVGDSILISSIQYAEFKFVVKPASLEDKIEIPLKLKVNKLKDVDIYSLGLTGNIEKDVKNIKVKDDAVVANSDNFEISKVYDEGVTTESEFTLRNVAMEENVVPASVDFKKVFKLIGKLFDKKKKDKSSGYYQNPYKSNKLDDLDFFVDYLKIDEDEIGLFIDYARSKGMSDDMLKSRNELELIQFLMIISKEFKADNEN
jgi:hypothetical protein